MTVPVHIADVKTKVPPSGRTIPIRCRAVARRVPGRV